MRPTTLREALNHLNGRYGRGTVREIRLSLAGEGEFDREPYGLRLETRTFRIRGLTVYALGRQVTQATPPAATKG
jgi:hypothetical protein